MKGTILRSVSALGLSLIISLSATAQDEPKVKNNHHEWKYKSNDLKVKLQKDEDKYKAGDLKIKENSNERKVKGYVKPMRLTKSEKVMVKTGETTVWTSPHQEAAMTSEDQSTTETASVKKSTTRKYAARGVHHKRTAARKTSSTHKYAMHKKTVRHYAAHTASQPEKIVKQTEYLHDTVFVTRVDTVVRIERMNTYAGYRVPRGDFKKVKLKRDRDGRVWMKRKE
jgi:hypothetical protein